MLVFVLDRLGDLIERAIDLTRGGIGARARVIDVRIFGAEFLATVRELDGEPIVAERVGMNARIVPGHHEGRACLSGGAHRLGKRDHLA